MDIHFCPVCRRGTTTRSHETVARAVSGFLRIHQVDDLQRLLEREHDVTTYRVADLCMTCLVRAMADLV